MVNNINYISLNEIASRLTRHPLMADLTLEPIIQYTIDFISVVGLPNMYIDKQETVEIDNYRGQIPCDLISIQMIRHSKNHKKFRGTTDNFQPDEKPSDYTFKSQGSVLITSMKQGNVDIAYRAIMVDDMGMPMIPDDGVFLNALQAYIKQEHFTMLSDLNKIAYQSLVNAQQDYSFKVGKLQNRFLMPSKSEMESISNMLNQIFPRVNEFNKGFKSLGNREYIKRH